MKALRLSLGALLVASFALVGLASSATAASTATYSGTFSGRVAYEGCTTEAPKVRAWGTWSVTLFAAGTASGDILIYTSESRPDVHVQYPFRAHQLPVEPGQVFAVTMRTQAGPLTLTLTADGAFTYVIAPYTYGGLTCDRVTYYGTVSK